MKHQLDGQGQLKQVSHFEYGLERKVKSEAFEYLATKNMAV